MASYWLQNRCVFRKYDVCVSHIHVPDQHSLPCTVLMIYCSILKRGKNSGKVKFTVGGVLQICLPCTVCGAWLHDIFISSVEHVSCIIVFVFRLIGGLSILFKCKGGRGPSFGMSHVST